MRVPSEMQQQLLFDGSSRARCPISTATRHARIGVFRHRLDGSRQTLATAPAQDAHLLIVQLKEHPPHDLWVGGQHLPAPQVGRGALAILDLRRETRALLSAEVDSLHVHLPRTALDDLAAEAGAPPVTSFSTGEEWTSGDQIAQQLSTLLAPVVEDPNQVAQAYLDHVVLAMASHIAATYGAMRPRETRPGSLAPWQLRRAQDMLASDPTDDVSLHEVADACGLSVSYFSRAFKATTGTTPHTWLQSCRVNHARGLLLDQSLPLAEIAQRSGFADQSHFTRVFRQSMGSTPGAWRRLKRER
ncbi:helix-turn-helix transcriptional regulator [Belnapia sp. T18]|uniref:Helix-turn-helix transcriptional regulator n=1 Tax=Belnapia arida TaxID=2804533 RepID=A0ABS1UA00_9PROT|nr:AraC family transcriptional regulator [Belnapia arida]MBL6081360.1 helix-turn-helix transcriptional regulator [Belnapia arida]